MFVVTLIRDVQRRGRTVSLTVGGRIHVSPSTESPTSVLTNSLTAGGCFHVSPSTESPTSIHLMTAVIGVVDTVLIDWMTFAMDQLHIM